MGDLNEYKVSKRKLRKPTEIPSSVVMWLLDPSEPAATVSVSRFSMTVIECVIETLIRILRVFIEEILPARKG